MSVRQSAGNLRKQKVLRDHTSNAPNGVKRWSDLVGDYEEYKCYLLYNNLTESSKGSEIPKHMQGLQEVILAENLAICGKLRLNLGLLFEIIISMSKNVSSDFDHSQRPDNPQETRHFAGFFKK